VRLDPNNGFAPLTSADKAKLLEMYPPNWQSNPFQAVEGRIHRLAQSADRPRPANANGTSQALNRLKAGNGSSLNEGDHEMDDENRDSSRNDGRPRRKRRRGARQDPCRMGGGAGLARARAVRQARLASTRANPTCSSRSISAPRRRRSPPCRSASWRSPRSVSRAFPLPCRTPGSRTCASSPTRSRTAARTTSPPITW
jgi:hypothetical protein